MVVQVSHLARHIKEDGQHNTGGCVQATCLPSHFTTQTKIQLFEHFAAEQTNAYNLCSNYLALETNYIL